MNKKTIWAVVLLVVVVVGLAITNKKSASNSIKVGVIATQTGVGSYFGEQAIIGIKQAVDDINNAGGVKGKKIELIITDSRTDNAAALSAAKKLVEIDHVIAIIGDSWNSTSATIMPYINDKRITTVSPVGTLDSMSADDYFFRVTPQTKDLMEPLAEYLYSKGIKTIAFAIAEAAFGREHEKDFKNSFESRGGKVVATEAFTLTSTDVRSELTRIKALKPDAIFDIHASGPSVGLLIKQGKDLGMKTQWVSSWPTENAALLSQYKEAIEGIIFPFFYDLNNSTTTEEFSERLLKLNITPNVMIANGYDSLKVLAHALETIEGDFTAEKLKMSLSNVRNYDGVSGVFSFNDKGDVSRQVVMKTVKDGKFLVLPR